MKIKLTSELIQGFVGSVLAKSFDDASTSPECHKEWWEYCCSPSKFVAIAAPRGHAKSTAITLGYGLAELLFRASDFAIIVSDTEAQAAMFLGSYKQVLQNNTDLIELFGIKKNDKGEVQFIKESETDIIVEFNDGHQFRVQAKGAEQKLRGLLWNNKRPNLVICDDLENDEIVLNKDRREKFRRWFYGALIPCMSANGKFRMVGTILHIDSLLERQMPSETDKQTFTEGLKTWTTRRGSWRSVKYKAHNKDYSEILWPSRFSKAWLIEKREDYVKQGLGDVYSQEFLNVPLDEANAVFKKSDFQPQTKEDKERKYNFYLTCDLAISQKEKADYSVFVVGAIDENRTIHVVNVVRDRLDGREIVDTLIALNKAYNFEAVGIEEGQISKSIGPFLREEMLKSNEFLNLVPLKHMSLDKVTRARPMQARMRARTVRFDRDADWFPQFEEELLRFPRDKHDDQVDAFSYLGKLIDYMVAAPTKKELDDEEYEEEFRKSNLNLSGRNATTGY